MAQNSKDKDHKMVVKVMIENGQVYNNDYVVKQKVNVIVEKAIAHFNLTDTADRVLRREDGTPITDLTKTIEETGLRDGETLRYVKKAPKPDDRDKGFA